MLTYRSVKGSPLSCEEIDENFKTVQNFKGPNPPTKDIGVNGDTYVKYKTYKDIADLNTFTYTEVNYKSKDIDTTKTWVCSPKDGKGSFKKDSPFWMSSEINPIELVSYFATGDKTKIPKNTSGTPLRNEPVLVLAPKFPSDILAKPEVSFEEYSSLIPITSIILNGVTYDIKKNYFPKEKLIYLQSDYITNLYNKIDSEIKVSIIFKSKKVLEKEDYYKEDDVWKKVIHEKNIFTLRDNDGLYPTVFGHDDSLAIGKNAVDFSTNSDKKIGAIGNYSFVEGNSTTASGESSHAEGTVTKAVGDNSHAEGVSTIASGDTSHAEGVSTIASGDTSHAEGVSTIASGDTSHAEGVSTTASGDNSHSEGVSTTASGDNSHAEGNSTIASGDTSHAEGDSSIAAGDYAHVEGHTTKAAGNYAHAEGSETFAKKAHSHAEGYQTTASGDTSHSGGYQTTASGNISYSEGYKTTASGYSSHAEGYQTSANEDYSHAEGNETIASGLYSHAEGEGTIASNNSSHAAGSYNIGTSSETIHETGNGFNDSTRSNAFEIYLNGRIHAPSLTTNLITDPKCLVTKEYLEANSSTGGATTLDALTDVTVTLPVTGDVLTFDGTKWNNTAQTIVASLNDLTDVAITSVTTGDKLVFDGTNWINDIPDFKIVDTLPAASLSLFEKSRYCIDTNKEYLCIANSTTPANDSDCFWVER